MRIDLPEPSLVVMVGTTGSGKTTFAHRHFGATEVLSSDVFRGLVSDDQGDQSATSDAFEVLHLVAARRLARRRLTVVDATNLQVEARRPLLALARQHAVIPVAIVLDVPVRICAERNRLRRDRRVGRDVLARQRQAFRRSVGGLGSEGFGRVWVLGPDDVDDVVVVRGSAAPGAGRERDP